MCAALGIGAPAGRDALRWTALGVLISQALPSSVGGDAYRIAAHGRREGYRAAARSVLHDRVNGLWVLAVLAVPGLALASALAPLALLVAAFVLGLPAAAWALARWPALAGEARAARTLLTSPPILATSAAIHAMTILAVATLAAGTAEGLWLPLALLAPFAMLAAALPVSFGGWGMREAVFVLAGQALAVPAADALAVSVAYGVLLLVGAAAGALAWILLPGAAPAESTS